MNTIKRTPTPMRYGKTTQSKIHRAIFDLRNEGKSHEEIHKFCIDRNILNNKGGHPSIKTVRAWLVKARNEFDFKMFRFERVWEWFDFGYSIEEIVELCEKNNVRTHFNNFPSGRTIEDWINQRPGQLDLEPTTQQITEQITKPTTQQITEQITKPTTQQITEQITKPAIKPTIKPIEKQTTRQIRTYVNQAQSEWINEYAARGRVSVSSVVRDLIAERANPTIKTVTQPTIKTIYQESLDVNYFEVEIVDQDGTHPNRQGSVYKLSDVVVDLFDALLTLGLRFSIIGMIIEEVLEWSELLNKQNKETVSMSIFVNRLATSLHSRGLQQRDLFKILSKVFK